MLGDDESLQHSYQGISANTLLSFFNSYINRSKPWLIRLLNARDETWFAHSAIPNGPDTWEKALTLAFEGTIDELKSILGGNILRWQYGIFHKITYKHPLATLKALESLFNRGPYPLGGDGDTVNVSTSSPIQPESVITVASYRHIIDLHTLDASLSIHAPGQSGHPASKHYSDSIQLWLEGKYHPLLYTPKRVEAEAEDTLHLIPKKT